MHRTTTQPYCNIPDDVVQNILDAVHDQATLKNCSLTRRSWVYYTQSRLFHEVAIDTEAKSRKFVALLTGSIHLSGHVQILHIKPRKIASNNLGLIQMNNWVHEIPEYLAQYLTRLHTLHFSRIDYELVDERFNMEFIKFPGIQTLKFTSCQFRQFDDFQNILSPFAHSLVSLSLDLVSWGDERKMESEPPAHPQPPPLTLKRLEIARHCKIRKITEWLLSSPSATRNLREVEFQLAGPEDLPDVGNFLYRLGTNLEHLTLGFKFERAPWLQEVLGDHLRLHANTNLQSLHIRILDLVSAHMIWIPAILSDLAILGGPDLQNITFDIWLWTKTQLHNEIWENMQRILNSESYASLKEVRFIQRGHVEDVTGGLRYELARWFLQSRFPELHARHILCVEDGKDYAT